MVQVHLPSAYDFFHFLKLLVVLCLTLSFSVQLPVATCVLVEHLCQIHLLGRDPIGLQVDGIFVLHEAPSA